LAAAGNIGLSEYNKLFPEEEVPEVSVSDNNAAPASWFVTDDSCWQCCREISDKVFELIQICKIGEGYDVAHGTINLDDYTIVQWEDYVKLYGHDGLRGFISDYNNTFPMRILAEYIFETEWTDYLQGKYFDAFDAAARFIADVVDCPIDMEGDLPHD
jgi:hypothetical protein